MSNIDPREHNLILQAKEGDSMSLELLFSKYINTVYGFLLRYMAHPPDAEDLTQETLLKAWKKLHTFKSEQKFKPWILKIAKNTLIDFWRKKKNNLLIDQISFDGDENKQEFDIKDDSPLPDELFDRTHLPEELQKSIKNLSKTAQQILLLHYQEDMTLTDIAEALDISPNTAKSIYRRAISKVRENLGIK